VVQNLTYRVSATDTWTGINALVTDTSLTTVTICVQDALRTTTGIRITMVFRQTRAHSIVALGVGATGRWVAGILRRKWVSN